MSEKCPVCRKEFEVPWPHLWRYKRKDKLLCSWSCLRKYDQKGSEKMMNTRQNDQLLTARQLLEAIEAGKDPMEWLKEQGYTNPQKAYQNLKARVQAKDPELAERFPSKRKPRKMAVPAAEKAEQEPIETGYTTTAIHKDEVGEFYLDRKSGTIDWRNDFGEEVSMPPADWARLAEEIPRMMKILRAEV